MNIFSKIKLLWKVKDPAEKLIDDLHGFKSGWRTWQFWTATLGSLVSLGGALAGIIPADASLIITTVLAGAYNWVRGMEKMDQNGTRPPLRSTEFLFGIVVVVGNILTALRQGGFDPAWIAQTQGVLSAIMVVAQSMGQHATPEAIARSEASNTTPPTQGA